MEIKQYLMLGFSHVIPFGLDHILFILSIFFFNSERKSILIQCTLFTIAHSCTLAIVALGYLLPNTNFVEVLIAASILFTSIENIVQSKTGSLRLIIIFLFGLIHGMGFAGALNDIGIPRNNFISALVSFNLGVELGQITVVLCAYFLISKWFKNKEWYHTRVVLPISTLIACIAVYWTVERIFLTT